MPDRFISVAESGGLIDTLSDRVAELAVRQLADWRGDGRNSFVSINLSAQNLADVQLPDRESTS
jgi:EAL domain-containing protein (putative c-di-GMP-specific phosphodiesterase class I)